MESLCDGLDDLIIATRFGVPHIVTVNQVDGPILARGHNKMRMEPYLVRQQKRSPNAQIQVGRKLILVKGAK